MCLSRCVPHHCGSGRAPAPARRPAGRAARRPRTSGSPGTRARTAPGAGRRRRSDLRGHQRVGPVVEHRRQRRAAARRQGGDPAEGEHDQDREQPHHRSAPSFALASTISRYCLVDVVGDRQHVQVGSAYLALRGDRVAQPVEQPVPVRRAEQHDRERRDLLRLHQGQRLEELVEGAEPPGSTTKPWEYFTNIVLRAKK